MTGAATQWVADRLTAGSVEGAVVVAVVWAVCRFASGIPASVQSMLWWLAALKLVLVLLPVPAIPIPLLPASDNGPAIAPSPTIARTIDTHAEGPEVSGAAGADVPHRDSMRGRSLDAIVALWLAIVLAQAVRLLRASRGLRAIVRRATPCSTDDAVVVAGLAARIGLRRAVDVRMSADIETPQVVGGWRPVVLLPAGAFTADERSMMVCHELMHVRRRDLAFGWVPAAAERLFFFHPLARLAAREYLAARESACDAAVVRALDVAPVDYARMLIRFGVAAGEPALTAGGSSASFSSLKRRLEMLQNTPSGGASSRSAWLLAAAVCALIPLQLAARTPAPQAAASTAAPAAPNESAPAAAPAEAVPASASPAPVEAIEQSASPAPAAAPPREAAPATAAAPSGQTPTQEIEAAMRRLAESARQRADDLRQRAAEAERTLEARQDVDERMRRANEMRSLMEEYHRALAELNARFESQSAERNLEQLARETQIRQLDELARREGTAEFLQKHLQELTRQQEILVQQLRQIAEQQQELSAAQRRLSEETERIRKRLEAK